MIYKNINLTKKLGPKSAKRNLLFLAFCSGQWIRRPGNDLHVNQGGHATTHRPSGFETSQFGRPIERKNRVVAQWGPWPAINKNMHFFGPTAAPKFVQQSNNCGHVPHPRHSACSGSLLRKDLAAIQRIEDIELGRQRA